MSSVTASLCGLTLGVPRGSSVTPRSQQLDGAGWTHAAHECPQLPPSGLRGLGMQEPGPTPKIPQLTSGCLPCALGQQVFLTARDYLSSLGRSLKRPFQAALQGARTSGIAPRSRARPRGDGAVWPTKERSPRWSLAMVPVYSSPAAPLSSSGQGGCAERARRCLIFYCL